MPELYAHRGIGGSIAWKPEPPKTGPVVTKAQYEARQQELAQMTGLAGTIPEPTIDPRGYQNVQMGPETRQYTPEGDLRYADVLDLRRERGKYQSIHIGPTTRQYTPEGSLRYIETPDMSQYSPRQRQELMKYYTARDRIASDPTWEGEPKQSALDQINAKIASIKPWPIDTQPNVQQQFEQKLATHNGRQFLQDAKGNFKDVTPEEVSFKDYASVYQKILADTDGDTDKAAEQANAALDAFRARLEAARQAPPTPPPYYSVTGPKGTVTSGDIAPAEAPPEVPEVSDAEVEDAFSGVIARARKEKVPGAKWDQYYGPTAYRQARREFQKAMREYNVSDELAGQMFDNLWDERYEAQKGDYWKTYAERPGKTTKDTAEKSGDIPAGLEKYWDQMDETDRKIAKDWIARGLDIQRIIEGLRE